MKYYISGPMTGLPDKNFPAFYEMEDEMIDMGIEPEDIINPATIEGTQNKTWVYYLKRDLRAMMDCDVVILLDGWEKSRGALLEVFNAYVLGMEFYGQENDFIPKCDILNTLQENTNLILDVIPRATPLWKDHELYGELSDEWYDNQHGDAEEVSEEDEKWEFNHSVNGEYYVEKNSKTGDFRQVWPNSFSKTGLNVKELEFSVGEGDEWWEEVTRGRGEQVEVLDKYMDSISEYLKSHYEKLMWRSQLDTQCEVFEEQSKPKSILQEAEDLTNGDRQNDYGHPSVNFQNTANLWNSYLNGKYPEIELEISNEDVGFLMALLKISREMTGPKRDNLVDCAGYMNTIQMIRDIKNL